ncbi:MAG: hypothetical protein BroJett040_08970 [Oligoflexia bacterium]|nr:MAG: hypothetical protein BroJett040_08970 [Oligoflexia bacterium]
MKTKKFQLKNGLNVILAENHRAPVVSVQMWVRTGSADEKKGEEGISHFIEHLVFKGSRKFGVGEIAARIEGAGGELNAYTSFDQTVFYVTLSKHFIDEGLVAINEMMGFPTFDETEINNEREVVIEEIKRGQDSLGRRASQLLFSTAFQKHAYGIPVIGYEKNIRSLSRKKIVQFYKDRYTPKNMFLVVAGDFDFEETKQKINKIYSEIPSTKLRKVTRKKEPKQNKGRIQVEHADFEQSVGYLSWKAPNIKHKDVPGLDVLSLILGQGDSSRLVHALRIDSAVVNSIGANAFTPKDEGLFTISFGYNKENLGEALEKITEEILRIQEEPAHLEEIKKAVLNIESEEFYSLETVDGLSRKMGSLEFYFQDLNYQNKYLQQLRSVTAADLQKLAKKYIQQKSMSLAFVTNDEVKKVHAQVKAWSDDLAKKMKALKVKTTKPKKVQHKKLTKLLSTKENPKTEKVVLPNGVTVLMRPIRDTQVISVKAAFLGGIRSEQNFPEGTVELLGRTWMSGTKQKTERDIYKEIESIASGISPIAGRNSVGLGVDCLKPFEQEARNLYLDILAHPTFPVEAIERERLVQIEQIQARNDNPAQCCIRLFMKNIFENHPYSRDMLGTLESVKQVTHKEIEKYWKQTAQKKNLTVMLCGNINQDVWLKEIQEATKHYEPGERFSIQTDLKPLMSDQRHYEYNKKEQSHAVFGFRGVRITDDERYALHLIQSILAGQGGRLFIELRDKNSLAYSVSPLRMEGVDTGYFGAYIGCSPEKVNKALAMMKEEFEKLCTEKVGEKELLRSKQYLIGRHDIDMQKTSSIGSSILYDDIYGIDYNEPFTCDQKYMAVTADEIMRLSKKILKGHSVTAVVGPQNPWE